MLLWLWIVLVLYSSYGECNNISETFREVKGVFHGNVTFTRTAGPYLVTKDLIVAQNSTLTIEPGTELQFLPNVGVRVHGSLFANGTHSKRITFRRVSCNGTEFCSMTNLTEFYNPGIRLVDGVPFRSGRLEIQWKGQWGSICDYRWEKRDTEVACRHLGFLGAKRHYRQPGNGSIWLKYVGCTGNEQSLWRCSYYHRIGQTNCRHDNDVGIECDTLIPFLEKKVFWKGIHFAPSNSSGEPGRLYLKNVDIINASAGIKAFKKPPEVSNITVRDGISGLLLNELESPLKIADSVITGCRLVGINVTNYGAPIEFQNVVVHNTSFGDGFLYKRIAEAKDFCSVNPNGTSLPLVLHVSGETSEVRCSKVFKANLGQKLSVHFRSLEGSEFELNVTDDSKANKTLLARITEKYNGKVLKTVAATVIEISLLFKGNARVPAKLEFAILKDAELPLSLVISNSKFHNNFKSGIRVRDVIGQFQITDSEISGNGGVGLHINGTQGKLKILSSRFVENQGHGVEIGNLSGTAELKTVNSSANQGSGIVITVGAVSLVMSDCQAEANHHGGLQISHQTNSSVVISDAAFTRNTQGNGIHLHDFIEDCQLLFSRMSSLGNGQNGALLQSLAVDFNVTSSSFDGNVINGIYIEQVDKVQYFFNISTSYNGKSGVYINRGRSQTKIESWSSIGNNEDGLFLNYRSGHLYMIDSFISANKKNGINQWDGNVRLDSFHLQNCSVLLSGEYGIIFHLSYGAQETFNNFSVIVAECTISNNSLGGFYFNPNTYWSEGSYRYHRSVRLSLFGNKLRGNNEFGVYLLGPQLYELTAVLKDNTFKENIGKTLRVIYYKSYYRSVNYPVNVEVVSNFFSQNKGEHVVYFDYSSLPSQCHARIENNTFTNNQGVKQDNLVGRTTTHACLVIGEGNFTVEGNVFENPLFRYELAVFLQDHERTVKAVKNWWGASDECYVKKRMFDFDKRVQLAYIEYYPFLMSPDLANVTLDNNPRPSCFLNGSEISGTLDRPVILVKEKSPYKVRDDVVVLPNGTLTIQENVTLEFPAKIAFVVQGRVIINGTATERIRFVPKTPPQEEVRLVEGSAPWDGRVEIWHNNTWMSICAGSLSYLTQTICSQLGYEAYSYHHRYASGNETYFIHNLRCSAISENLGIMKCGKESWTTSSTCFGYVASIRCRQPYWVGVHLAMTAKTSTLHNLDITYAGFAYRDDLRIPGSSLRIDFSHHSIQGVKVNNSAFIGIQVMYPDPFKNIPDIVNSTIMNTGSDGVRLHSPFLDLRQAVIANTAGNGFWYGNNWDNLNDQVIKMADPRIRKSIDLCSDNSTFLNSSDLAYYLKVTAEGLGICESVINIPQRFTIGMQLLNHPLNSYQTIHIYNGTNATSAIPWEVQRLKWHDRPTWRANSSSIFLRSTSWYYNSIGSVHFILYLIEDTSTLGNQPAGIRISQSLVYANARDGIQFRGQDLGSILIEDSVIRDSPYSGISTYSGTVQALNLSNCSVFGNKYGIWLGSFSGDVNIENTEISNSSYYAIFVDLDGPKRLRLINSKIKRSERYGLYMGGSSAELRLIVRKSFFGWNKGTSVYSHNRYASAPNRSSICFEQSTFLLNQGPVVDIQQSTYRTQWLFEGNVFANNTEPTVLMTSMETAFSFSPVMAIKRNQFISNRCQGKGVIDVRGGFKELVIDGNLFGKNQGRSLYVEGSSVSPLVLTNNVFDENDCSNTGVAEVRRMENEFRITDNVFRANRGLFVVLLQCVYEIRAQMDEKNVTLMNNTLVNNTVVPYNFTTCEVNISGILENRNVLISHNKFNSHDYSKELCVNIPATSSGNILNASLNFWGYDHENEIRERIFDSDDNHDNILALFIPFINSNESVVQDARTNESLESFSRVLNGRISQSIRLTSNYSPYVVTSDVIILLGARVIVDPGVEVQMGPGVSVLVLGSLTVQGTPDLPVKFTALGSSREQDMSARLSGGLFPWQGRLEVLYNSTWMPVCSDSMGQQQMNNAKVACGQLGYQPPSGINQNNTQISPVYNKAWPFKINCIGNEKNIEECPISFLSAKSCDPSRHVILHCGGGMPWGSIRFARESKTPANSTTSKLEHMELEYCGRRHGENVAAIEAMQYVPELHSVRISNCLTGGLKIVFPEQSVHVTNSSFFNTGGNGTEIEHTKWNVTISKIKSINNEHGLTFFEPNRGNTPSLHYGHIMLCSPEAVVNMTRDRQFLYFSVPYIIDSNARVSCQKLIQAKSDEALVFKLVFLTGNQDLRIVDRYGREVVMSAYRDSLKRLTSGVLVPWNTVTVTLYGDFAGEMLLQIERLKTRDIPCTFERSSCGWKDYPRSSLKNITLNRKWYLTNAVYSSMGYDHTYNRGNYMYQGKQYSPTYGALVSLPVLREHKICDLVFYFKLWKSGYASLSVFIEAFYGKNDSLLTPLWTSNQTAVNWKKQSLRLPQTLENYTVIFLGYNQRYHYVTVDDISFRRCDAAPTEHGVTGSVFSGNRGHGVHYTSINSDEHVFRMERCEVTNNALGSSLAKLSPGAIHLNATNQVFQLYNNYIADNKNGGIYAKLQTGIDALETAGAVRKPPGSRIHGNTIETNRGESLLLEGTSGEVSEVNVTKNHFSRNLATNYVGTVHSVCKMTDVVLLFEENFFFNNSGHYVVEYHFSQAGTGLNFVRNTLYLNRGMGVNYGMTILCNGAAEIHGNILQNPSNRYQIGTTLQGNALTTNATSNWWGVNADVLVASLIKDKTTDFRLSLTIVYKPFLQLPSQTVLTVSCPPEWIREDSQCVLYKGGAVTFLKAKSYCEYYGGTIVTMTTAGDRALVEALRQRESHFRSKAAALWTLREQPGVETIGSLHEDTGICSVVAANGEIENATCDELHPFVCVRRPVVRCPNSCFHNGECVGAICFCFRGWTGADCSQFHCNDLHDCSRRGKCVGPNVCKCLPGFLGRGCTYSYCGKYESCSDCVTDPSCGWCDSLSSCLGGFAVGPPHLNCSDWFYHHCYTIDSEQHCSRNIQRVDCIGKYCNFQDGKATTESCQKCKDLDRCYKNREGDQCRTWNETHCPGGEIRVDYTDPNRTSNVELAKNVRVVDPNTTVIYACPVMMDEETDMSLVFIAPKNLDVQADNILCSSQAGGIMHKIVKVVNDGPYKLILSSPAGLEEVIDYADYKEKASIESIADEATLEDEPDTEDIDDLISGNITVNESQLVILSPEITVYKCLGHTYEVDNRLVYSYYLVLEKTNLTTPGIGDILVSNVSHGFIENVEAVSNTTDTLYLETKLQRCNEHSQWPSSRLKSSRQQFSKSTFCSGGDNNPGMIVSEMNSSHQQFVVNDSIVGRPSGGFIAKVVQVHSKKHFVVIEVIAAKVGENRTINTDVEMGNLQSHHRRTRRSTDTYTKDVENFYRSKAYQMVSRAGSTIEGRLTISLRLAVFLEIEKEKVTRKVKDASIGLTLEGTVYFGVDFRVKRSLSYSRSIVMKKKRLGTVSIRIGPVSIPAGLFFGLRGRVTAAVSGSFTQKMYTSGRVVLGSKCRWSSGCHVTDNTFNLRSNWSPSKTEVKTGARVDVTVTPKISLQLPVSPKWFGRLMNSKWFSPLKKLVGKIKKYVDLSLELSISAPFKARVSVIFPTNRCNGKTPAELRASYGMSNLICGVSVVFIGKRYYLPFPTGVRVMKTSSYCFCPEPQVKHCTGTTVRPTKQPTAKPDNNKPTKKPDGNGHGGGGNTGGHGWGSGGVKNTRPPPCGKEPCCAGNRKGPGCSQPDFWPYKKGCNRNGVPQSTSGCDGSCRCFGGWGGAFCDRAAASGGGDPHLATLDGKTYDFFGIGEFWGCKSSVNNFGLQYRFFYYKRASLIGGVALKAGRSIVTVMTMRTQDPRDPPILRIDGDQVNLTRNSSTIEIDNSTVLLDFQRSFNTIESEENGVVLISLQYESGVAVTIDVRQSHVMKRQYLNVVYSPTATYKGHTAGLCGFMDNDPTNDFTGPTGNLYKNAVQFSESWRIKDCHNGCGRRDSWLWNSSNFYHEDVMDLSYTDPTYVPLYSLDGISKSILQLANSTCQALGISGNDLQSCIFDVAVTNDTTFTDQEVFKAGCVNQCSGKGRCDNGTCRCIDGWHGDSCDKGSCLNCSTLHGTCVKGFCHCKVGWEGRSCELKATCNNVNNCTSPVHGVCKTTDVCQCNPGYTGHDCSIVPTCLNVLNCSGNGMCVDFDVCKCNKGWLGANCSQFSCTHLDYCSGHGHCVGLYKCDCYDGWTGASCALPDCAAVNQCSGQGECVSSDTCRCYDGFQGANCSHVPDCEPYSNCSEHGVCVFKEASSALCRCYAGFTGPNCSVPTCAGVNNCSAHGLCTEADFCVCYKGYSGADCSNVSCEAVNYCSGNGECVGFDVCRCNSSWSGMACNIPDCSAVKQCSNQGDCILPDTCACYASFDGIYCDRKAEQNIDTPSFDKVVYDATIVENYPVGTVILQLQANDTDSGRNGKVFYTIVGDQGVGSHFVVDGMTGMLSNSLVFDFENLTPTSYNVTIMASDNGVPQKSGFAVVRIAVTDENDNCPTFTEPFENAVFEIDEKAGLGAVLTRVSAYDLDSGINSAIVYDMSSSYVFSIDPYTGVITVTSNLTSMTYDLIVAARDNGTPSCATERRLIVKVTALSTMEPSTNAPNKTSTFPSTSTKYTGTTSSGASETTKPTTEIRPAFSAKSTTPGAAPHLPTDATAEPQQGLNFIVIGFSVFGGILVLVVGALVIKKIVCKQKVTPAHHWNEQPTNFDPEDKFSEAFELSSIPNDL